MVYVQNGTKPYIIDSWLGFADYVPNTIKRFQKEFRNISTIERFLKPISQDELKKLCPELFKNKKP